MRRLALLALTAATLMPAGGCVAYCSDSRGTVRGRNHIPFTRKYRLCNGRHCQGNDGQHLDVRCRCSKQCDCWGATSVAMAVDTETGAQGSDVPVAADAEGCGGCGCGE